MNSFFVVLVVVTRKDDMAWSVYSTTSCEGRRDGVCEVSIEVAGLNDEGQQGA